MPGLSPTTTKSVFFDTEPDTLPPRDWIGLLGPVAGEALERAGDDDAQALERSRVPRRTASSTSRTPAARHLADDRPVPVDLPPLAHGDRDDRPDALDRGQPLLVGGEDRVHDRSSRASAWAAVGPTCRIDSATSTRQSGRSLAAAIAASSLRAVGGEPAVLEPEQRGLQELVLVEVEDVTLVLHDSGVEQRDRGLVAEDLDVEAAAPGQVEQPLAQLGRAGPAVGAADVGVALLLRLQRRCRRRGSAVGITNARSEPSRRSTTGPDDLGDDVAGLAQHHRVADQHALALHLGRVVQGRHLDRRAADEHRLHHAVRRDPTGAADVDPDVEQLGRRPPRAGT